MGIGTWCSLNFKEVFLISTREDSACSGKHTTFIDRTWQKSQAKASQVKENISKKVHFVLKETIAKKKLSFALRIVKSY